MNSYNQNNAFIPDYDSNFDYSPIKAWGYFGYTLLFGIPIIGFILLVVFSLGGTRNINLRNYARSYFCILALFLILFGILFATGLFAIIPNLI